MTRFEDKIEVNLRRAATRWKLLRMLRDFATIGSLACLAFALIAVLMTRWIDSKEVAEALVAVVCVISVITFFATITRIAAIHLDREILARTLENSDSRLQDRLNTLVHLQKSFASQQTLWFLPRILRQSQAMLRTQEPALPLPPTRTWLHVGVFAILLVGTFFVYHRYSPWQHVLEAERLRQASYSKGSGNSPELALPTNNVAEEQKPWGEVRITDPAHDLKVTKVDVVPMQIEAAANATLTNVGWFSTINGTDEKSHPLPAPKEPRYAVYQPVLYLDELGLADWDVMTYYANARTEGGIDYASEVYFLEVRPFREDILKMPGGESGKAYQALSDMTDFIERQQHVIRQTHQYQQTPNDTDAMRKQDRKKLSGAEDDLQDSVKHLYAKMSSEMENQPIGEALDNLAQADAALGGASKGIDQEDLKEGQNQERGALADLIAARKMYQKAISEHPEKFADQQKKDDEPVPLPESMKKLGDIAEFRDEAKAAQDFVQKAIDQQQKLAEEARNATLANRKLLSTNESALAKSLEDFARQHPEGFRGLTNAEADATNALNRAADLLPKKTRSFQDAMSAGTEKLQALQSGINHHAARHELSDAYKLKELLDKQIKNLQAYQNATNEISRTNLQQTAAESSETLKQLKQVAETKPTRDAFGPRLRDSLSGANKAALDSQLNQLTNSQGAASQRQAADAAAHGLQNVSQAFSASEPSAMQASEGHDSLKPNGQESFERGMQQLESLKQDLENNHSMSADQEERLRQEAWFNLKEGLLDLKGKQEAAQLLLLLDQEIKEPGHINLAVLKKLMDQLRDFSVEVADKKEKSDNPDLTNIDPSKLPPAYRGRIQKYYQKLSDQKP